MYSLDLPDNIIKNTSFCSSLLSKTIFLFYGLQILFLTLLILLELIIK